MADLKTNYVDDVLDTTKNQLRKYQQIKNDDGTVSFVDVTEYTQVGTSFGAKDINDTNAAINDVNGNLTKTNETVSSYFKTYTVGSGNGSELTDCNDLPLYSIGYVYPTAKNNAFSTSNMVFTIGTILSSIVYKVQFAISSDDGSLKTRYKSNGGWTAWKAS